MPFAISGMCLQVYSNSVEECAGFLEKPFPMQNLSGRDFLKKKYPIFWRFQLFKKILRNTVCCTIQGVVRKIFWKVPSFLKKFQPLLFIHNFFGSFKFSLKNLPSPLSPYPMHGSFLQINPSPEDTFCICYLYRSKWWRDKCAKIGKSKNLSTLAHNMPLSARSDLGGIFRIFSCIF